MYVLSITNKKTGVVTLENYNNILDAINRINKLATKEGKDTYTYEIVNS